MDNAPALTTQLFHIVGFVATGLALLVPAFWFIHWRCKVKGWHLHLALLIAVVAFAGAKFNSLCYVNLIEQDRSEELAALSKEEEARKKTMEADRAEDIADVRFVEDGGKDYLDVGGMDETDLRLHGLKGPKLEKKVRSTSTVDSSLEGALQSSSSEEKEQQLDAEVVEEDVVQPIVMSKDNLDLANRLDGLLLSILRGMIFLTIVYLIIDYLRRLNRYEDSYFPLPLPSLIVETLAPVPGVRKWPSAHRRTILKELEELSRRNQPFLYFGDDPQLSQQIPSHHFRLPARRWPIEVLPIHFKGHPLHEDFIFEALWYGRSSFYSDNPIEAKDILMHLANLMIERKEARAKTAQTVNLVWNLSAPLSKDIIKLFSLLGPETGFSLVLAPKRSS